MTKSLTKLGEVCELINGGAWKQTEYVNDGIPVVQVSNMKSGTIDLSDLKYLPLTSLDHYKKHILKECDLVVATVGSHATQASAAGRATFIRGFAAGMLLNQNAVAIRSKSESLDQRYLGLVGCSDRFQSYLGIVGQGAANQVRIALSAIKEFKFDLPPINVQRKIVEIISAYDDLIENNRRRIVLLDQAARLLYKEWFVRLRFPGHEHVEIVDGVPGGWGKKCLEDLAQITMGQSPESQYYNEGGIGLPFHQGVSNFGMRFPTDKTYCTVENRIGEVGDILFSVRAPVGRINITLYKIVIGRGLAAIRSKCEQQNFLFYQLKSHFFKEDMMGGGAIFAAITKKDLHGVELLTPTRQLIESFQEHVTVIDNQIETLHKATGQLTCARDLLLPRLMNGELAA